MSLDNLMAAHVDNLFFSESHFGRSISLSRDTTTVTATAIPVQEQARIYTADGLQFRMRIRQFLIPANQYQFGGGTVTPAAGDEIVDGGTTYEIHTPAGAESPWEWDGPDFRIYRVNVVER